MLHEVLPGCEGFFGEKNTHSESSANIQKYYERDEYSIDVSANELAANLRVTVDIASIACRGIFRAVGPSSVALEGILFERLVWQCCIYSGIQFCCKLDRYFEQCVYAGFCLSGLAALHLFGRSVLLQSWPLFRAARLCWVDFDVVYFGSSMHRVLH